MVELNAKNKKRTVDPSEKKNNRKNNSILHYTKARSFSTYHEPARGPLHCATVPLFFIFFMMPRLAHPLALCADDANGQSVDRALLTESQGVISPQSFDKIGPRSRLTIREVNGSILPLCFSDGHRTRHVCKFQPSVRKSDSLNGRYLAIVR